MWITEKIFAISTKIFSVIRNLALNCRRAETDERNNHRANQGHHQNIVDVQIILAQHDVSGGEPDNH